MTGDTKRDQSTAVSQRGSKVECGRLAELVVAGWRSGEPVDAAAAFAEHPELQQFNSIALDLAYEEYCLRAERGESLSISHYCQKFPKLRNSLRHQLDIHFLMEECESVFPSWTRGDWPKLDEPLLGYSVLAELGRGAFARVYLAKEQALGQRYVAIKVTRDGESEADILGKLQHDNIIPIHSVQFDEDTGYTVICMPYRGRATLNHVLDFSFSFEGPPQSAGTILEAVQDANSEQPEIPTEASNPRWSKRRPYLDGILHLATQLADALQYAHESNILHLDLKPSNVLVTEAGTPLLLDFNLSVDRFSNTKEVGGTLPYMSPEQLHLFLQNDDGFPIDGRSDVFSMGVILFQLLTGEEPFGESPEGLGRKECAAELLRRRQNQLTKPAGRELPPAVSAVVKRCLAFAPDDRYASAAELAAELRRLTTPASRFRRWLAAHRLAASVVTSIAVLVFVSVTIILWSRPPRAVRLHELGMNAFAAEDYASTIELLTDALDAEPETPAEILFDRARARARNEEFTTAIDDLQQCMQLQPTQHCRALMGYCCNMAGYARDAVMHYQNALGDKNALDDGPVLAPLFNNLGVSYARLDQATVADGHLTDAIKLDGSFQAAFHNRALVRLALASQAEDRPESALDDVEHAMSLGEPSEQLLRDAALIFAYASRFAPGNRERAREYLRLARQINTNPPPATLEVELESLLNQHASDNSNIEFDYLQRVHVVVNPIDRS